MMREEKNKRNKEEYPERVSAPESYIMTNNSFFKC